MTVDPTLREALIDAIEAAMPSQMLDYSGLAGIADAIISSGLVVGAGALGEVQEECDSLALERQEAITARDHEIALREAIGAQAAADFEAASEIDDCWAAIGTRGNKATLSLSEQVSSLLCELDAAEAERDAAHAAIREYLEAEADYIAAEDTIDDAFAGACKRFAHAGDRLRALLPPVAAHIGEEAGDA